jgi:pimeloyl-ACP methyl ester carboxylesterase
MKKITTLLSLFLSISLFAQTAKRDTGMLDNAAFEVQFPENWNKKLVLYAHGYELTSVPPRTLYPDGRLQNYLQRGFAVARSSYSRVGWALPEGIDNTESLRKYFVKKYGKPDSTFIVGHSMGGGVTVATIEKFPKVYNGGLALCPLSNRPYEQTKIAFDYYVVFNALFPNYLPSVADVMSGKDPSVFGGNFTQNIQKAAGFVAEIKQTKPDLLEEYLKHSGLKLQDLPFTLVFLDGVLHDMAKQTGGNPYDNSNTVYTGYSNDWELNKKVERLAATASNQRLTTYDRTGVVDKPLLLMHTTYDQLIHPRDAINPYDALVHEKRKEQNLKTFFTNGQGHCAFTPQQEGMAFDALRAWAKSGQKPTEIELPSASNAPKDTLCYELRIYTATKGNLNNLLKRFRNHTTKLFEKQGMTNVGYWTPLDNADEKLYYVLSYPNRAAREASWKAFMSDTAWQNVQKASEINGGLVAKVESIFLKTTDFSPNNMKSSLNSNVWEFRIYTTTPNNLGNLMDRFRGFTVNRFAQYGMTNKMYWTATDAEQGSDKMLYYFLTHPSQDAAKEAFDKFRADPEWIATRKASEVKGGGSLTVKVESIFMVATDFSKAK